MPTETEELEHIWQLYLTDAQEAYHQELITSFVPGLDILGLDCLSYGRKAEIDTNNDIDDIIEARHTVLKALAKSAIKTILGMQPQSELAFTTVKQEHCNGLEIFKVKLYCSKEARVE